MNGVSILDAGIEFPVVAFPKRDDVMPFAGIGLLSGKTGWLAEQGRHIDMEIVDAAGRCWVVSGLVERQPVDKKWWQFGRSTDAADYSEAKLRPMDPQSFETTRRRVECLASRIFDDGDEALAGIRTASTMAELGGARSQITTRAQVRRILAGDCGIPMRPASAVAQRAIILFALTCLSVGVDRLNIIEWLSENILIVAISPGEAELLSRRLLSDHDRAEAAWHIEGFAALLWALGRIDMPAPDALDDVSAIADVIASVEDRGIGDFVTAAILRPAAEIAAMAEACHRQISEARRVYDADGSERSANRVTAARRRAMALQWILNPDRLNWE